MKRVRFFVLAGLVLAALVGVAPLASAASLGSVQVTVYSVSGTTKEAVIGATVELSDANKQTPPQARITNENGQVIFPMVPVGGAYVVTVTMEGYVPHSKPNIRVVAGVTTQVPIGLLADISVEVKVIGKSKMVELETEAQGTTAFSAEEFSDLPVFGRDYQAVLPLAPGVQDTDGDGNPTVHGSRQEDLKTTVDGVSNVDPLSGRFLSNVNPDAIEEIQILDSGADASHGGAVGAYAKIVTKSGSNKFEGAVNLYLRHSMFNGDGAGGFDPADYRHYQPSLFFSGPVVRDKLWFSLNHEWLDTQSPINVIGGSSFVQTLTSERVLDKLTWQVTPKNKLQLQWSANPIHFEPGGVDRLTPADSGYTLDIEAPTWTAKWTAPFSPTFFWEATVAQTDYRLDYGPYNRAARNTCVLDDETQNPWSYLSDYQCEDFSLAGRTSGTFYRDYGDRRRRWTYDINADQYIDRWLGGQHHITAGLSLERVEFRRDVTNRPYLQLFNNGAAARGSVPGGPGGGGASDSEAFLLSTTAAYFPGQQEAALANLLGPQRGLNSSFGNYYAAFVSDSFEPRSNLSIGVGVRFQREELTGDGYRFFDPAAERALYDQEVRRIVQECVAELGCTPGNTRCYQACVDRAYSFALAVFTLHPLDDPNLVTIPPEGAPPDWVPGPDDRPTCSNAINPLLCDQLAITKWSSPFIENGLLSIRQTETFTIRNNAFAPRLTASWDPRNDGKTRLSATWGRYYGDTFLAPLVAENGPDYVGYVYALDNARRVVSSSSGILPRSLLASAFSVNVVNRNLKKQYNDEWTVGVEREIASETAIKLRYVNRKYRDQFQDVDANHQPVSYEDMRNRPPTIYPYKLPPDFTELADCPMVKGFYDCTGALIRDYRAGGGGLPGPGNPTRLQPDGLPDLQVISPFFANVYRIGNYNSSRYQAYIVELTRRFFQNWELNGSYTWSRALGQAEEWGSGLGSDPTNSDDEEGLLATDQTHVFKLHGRVFIPRFGGFRVGGALSFQSGLPYSIIEVRPVVDFPTDLSAGEAARLGSGTRQPTASYQVNRVIYPTGQRNDQRNAAFWQVNVNFQKEFMIRDVKASVQAEIFNLLNDNTDQIYYVQRQLVGITDNGATRIYVDVPVAEREFGRQFQVALRVNF